MSISSQNMTYMCITAYYIDQDSWEMQKRIISFKVADSFRTGYDVGEMIKAESKSWGLQYRIFSITADQASYISLLSANFTFSSLYDSVFRIKCCSHVLDLVVNSGMNLVSSLMNNIRNCVKYIRGAINRKYTWDDACVEMGMAVRDLIVETDIHWSSTYCMLTRALKYKKVIVRFLTSQLRMDMLPSNTEWKELRSFRDFLQPFHDATSVFSQVYQPTSMLVLHQLAYIELAFQKYEKHQNNETVYKSLIKDMRAKYYKYWKPLPLLFGIAFLFDPRYKEYVLRKVLTFIYGEEDGSTQYTNIITKTEELFDGYLASYEDDFRVEPSTSSVTCSVQVNDPLLSLLGLKRPSQATTTELQRYLNETVHDEVDGFNLLNWWKVQQKRYPILSIMVRDLFQHKSLQSNHSMHLVQTKGLAIIAVAVSHQKR